MLIAISNGEMCCVSEHAGSFMWFSHMWNHQQPHLYDNITQLEIDMTLNREFAKVCCDH
jgi:heparan sulfate N-deacetylase/N-sulfotransferase NDST2